MGKRSRNFKLNKKNKTKHIPKEKYDYSQFNGRVIGCLPDGYPIIGSKSHLIECLTNNSIAPFEVYDTKMVEFRKVEMKKLKKYMGNNDISAW